MSIYRNLQPHVHVLKLTGGTGDGKTEIATVFASKEARTVLLRNNVPEDKLAELMPWSETLPDCCKQPKR